MEKREFWNKIIELTGGEFIPCKKKSLENIVFPKWSDIGLLGMMFRQCVVTKEAPSGQIYNEAEFRSVLRVLDGKVLMNNMLDSYTWTFETFQKKANTCEPIGTHSALGLINLSKVILGIKDSSEQSMFADMFAKMSEDLLLVKTDEEDRLCIEVTQELYDEGLNYSIDSWLRPKEDGSYDRTILNVGDFLIIEKNVEQAYCIRRAEFMETHKLV